MTVAIIIPAFNAAAFLGEAVESALAQTHAASQIVVVDDGSTDTTAAVAEKFADAVMFLRQANAGVSAARNHGAAQVAADWLLFLDADDRLRPDALARLLSRANESMLGAIYGQTADFTDESPLGPRFSKETGSCAMQGPPPAG